MALLDRILPRRKTLSIKRGPWRLNDDGGLTLLAGQQSTAGVTVDEEKAMSLSSVFAAVNFLSRVMSSLPLSVYRRKAGGGKEVATDSHVHFLLHTQPNPEMSAVLMRRVLEFHRLLFGAAVAVCDGEMPDGSPEAIWPVEPWRLKPTRDQDNRLYFSLDGGREKIDPARVLYIPLISYDGVCARSFIDFALESLGLALGEQVFAAAYFGNGARPGGILRIPGAPDDKKRKEFHDSWARVHGGAANANRVGVLWGGWEWIDGGGSMKPIDAQLLESRRFATEEVARWFGLPVNFLQDLSRATFSNIEEQGRNLVTYTLQPIATEYEAEYNRKLCGPDTYTKHNFDALQRGKFSERMAGYRQGFEVGAYSVNDILELEDRDPLGTMGDQRFVPANLVTLQKASQPEPVQPQPPSPTLADLGAEIATRLAPLMQPPVVNTPVTVSVPGQPAPVVNSPVTVNMPEQPAPVVNAPVTVNMPEIAPADQPNIVINIPEQPAPVVNVTNKIPEQPAPQVAVENKVVVPEPRLTTKRIERDENGDIVRVVEE